MHTTLLHYILFVVLFLRRENETEFSIETLCHDPSIPLYGIMLDDYNTSTCEMKDKNTTSGMAQICSCTGEECNDMLLFFPSEYKKFIVIRLHYNIRINSMYTINGVRYLQFSAAYYGMSFWCHRLLPWSVFDVQLLLLSVKVNCY